MFIERFGRIWWERLRRDVEPRRRNDQLGRSVGNGGLSFDWRTHRHGRKRHGRSALDGRRSRLGWVNRKGWGNGNGRRDGWIDNRAIGRHEQLRRKVGVWR